MSVIISIVTIVSVHVVINTINLFVDTISIINMIDIRIIVVNLITPGFPYKKKLRGLISGNSPLIL